MEATLVRHDNDASDMLKVQQYCIGNGCRDKSNRLFAYSLREKMQLICISQCSQNFFTGTAGTRGKLL